MAFLGLAAALTCHKKLARPATGDKFQSISIFKNLLPGTCRMRSELAKCGETGDRRPYAGRRGQSKVMERRELRDHGRLRLLCTEPRPTRRDIGKRAPPDGAGAPAKTSGI